VSGMRPLFLFLVPLSSYQSVSLCFKGKVKRRAGEADLGPMDAGPRLQSRKKRSAIFRMRSSFLLHQRRAGRIERLLLTKWNPVRPCSCFMTMDNPDFMLPLNLLFAFRMNTLWFLGPLAFTLLLPFRLRWSPRIRGENKEAIRYKLERPSC